MSRVILLDSGPLGLVTNPRRSPANMACAEWLRNLGASGVRIIIPEIADYEIRRELLRSNKVKGIAKLNALIQRMQYLPITTAAMRQAALFWAQARQVGRPTASDKAIDGDMILAGQAVSLGLTELVVATTNVGHLSRFVAAEDWAKIRPS